MARVKYYNQETSKWEYADAAYGGSGSGNGQPGADGKDGVSATHEWNGTVLTITSASGTSSADLKGEKGLDATPVAPLFANSVAECTDTSKFYVLSDGYIYAYLYQEATGPAYTNLAGAVMENTRQNSSAVAKELTGAITTGFIPVKQGDKVRVKGFNPKGTVSGNYPYVCFFTDASESAVVATDKWARGDGDLWTLNGDVYEYTPFKLHTGAEHSLASSITHIRINGAMTGSASDVIVTVNQEIVEGTAGGYFWTNTGHAFVPADYESRILSLESHTSAIPVSRINEIESTLEDIQTTKPWDGKKWVVVGDSLTQALNSDGTNANTDKYYHTHIAEETGISVVNMGQGGTGYKKTDDSGYAFYQRIVNVPTDADVVTIFGSINDLSRTANYTIGEPTDTGTDTVCGCINTTLDNLFATFPLANVGVITPMPTKYYNYFNFEEDTRTQRIEEYCDKLMEICHRRSIPVLDMFHGSGMRAWDKSFRDTFYSNESVEGDGERGGIHPDATGHAIMATKIKDFLDTLMEGYNDVGCKTPIKGEDYFTEADIEEIALVTAQKVPFAKMPTEPSFAQGTSEMTDTSKVYVNMETGTFWQYKESTMTREVMVDADSGYTYPENSRLSSGNVTSGANYTVTPFIDLLAYPVPFTLHLDGAAFLVATNDNYTRVAMYTAEQTLLAEEKHNYTQYDLLFNVTDADLTIDSAGNGTITFNSTPALVSGAALRYIRLSGKVFGTPHVYVTYKVTETDTVWTDTGISYAPNMTEADKQQIVDDIIARIDTELLSVIGSGEVV